MGSNLQTLLKLHVLLGDTGTLFLGENGTGFRIFVDAAVGCVNQMCIYINKSKSMKVSRAKVKNGRWPVDREN